MSAQAVLVLASKSVTYCFCATPLETEPSWEDPMVEWDMFRADSPSHSVGDLMSGSQKAMMSSSISMKDRELSLSAKSHSEVVESSSSSSNSA